MKLTFLGTRGEIDARTSRHRMHTSLLVSWRRSHVMIDCGADWQRRRVEKIAPTAILITHAHPDHADGLKKGVSCPVFATQESWNTMRPRPIPERAVVQPRCPFDIHGIRFEAFQVEHSLRAPAVGYRISTDRTALFYAPDIVRIHDQQEYCSTLATELPLPARLFASAATQRYFYCDSLAFYVEELKPLSFQPQPKRNLKPFRGQIVGLNTGEGTLPFPTREETILPANFEKDFQTAVREVGRNHYQLQYKGRDATITYEYKPKTGNLSELTASVNAGTAFRPMDGGGVRFPDTPEGKAAEGKHLSMATR